VRPRTRCSPELADVEIKREKTRAELAIAAFKAQ
jgi:hypothetical protein